MVNLSRQCRRIEPTGGVRSSGPARHDRVIIEPLDLYYLGGSGVGFGCVGDPGGTLGFGVSGFEEGGGVGTSGGEFGIDGDEGDGGTCCAQPTVIAQSAMAARVDPVRFICALLYKV
jgi:hypothetical protein